MKHICNNGHETSIGDAMSGRCPECDARNLARGIAEASYDAPREPRFAKRYSQREGAWIVGRIVPGTGDTAAGCVEVARFTAAHDGQEIAKSRAGRFIALEESVADELAAQAVAHLQAINDDLHQQAADNLAAFSYYIENAM